MPASSAPGHSPLKIHSNNQAIPDRDLPVTARLEMHSLRFGYPLGCVAGSEGRKRTSAQRSSSQSISGSSQTAIGR